MNFRDLEYLVALQEEKHFRKAAERCFVSQPTLSGQIRKLEDELGLLLIERTSRKVIFTHAGDEIVAKARTILLESQNLKEMAREFQSPMSGPIHIGLIPTVAPYLLPKIISFINTEFPNLRLFLYEEQTHVLLQRLEDGELDCLVLAHMPNFEKWGSIPLYDEPLCLAFPENHPWKDQAEIGLADLSGESVLMLEDGHCLRDHALDYCFAAGAQEDTTFKATSLETLRHMVSAGMGITLLPQLAVPKQRHQNGIIYKNFTAEQPTRQICMLYRKNSVRRPCFNQLAASISAHWQS